MAIGRKTLGLRSFVANLAKHLCAPYGGVGMTPTVKLNALILA